jgi:hypothetical protein
MRPGAPGDAHRNDYLLKTIRLWEHADRIRGGELAELAPLLILCDDIPSERSLWEPDQEHPMPSYTVVVILAIAGALCLALMAAARRWPGDGRRSGRSQDQDRDEHQYLLRLLRVEFGELQDQKREALLRILRARFGELPPAVVTRVESADPERCEEMLKRAATAESLEEMGF